MPPWNKKDERQFKAIKSGYTERDSSDDRAEEIAARTVNKSRREEGRTPNQRTQGTGNPNHALEDRSRDELYNIARGLHVIGRSGMRKQALVVAIRSRQ